MTYLVIKADVLLSVHLNRDRTSIVNEAWTEMEESLGVRMTVDHYNALLAVYADNNHAFCPEHVS